MDSPNKSMKCGSDSDYKTVTNWTGSIPLGFTILYHMILPLGLAVYYGKTVAMGDLWQWKSNMLCVVPPLMMFALKPLSWMSPCRLSKGTVTISLRVWSPRVCLKMYGKTPKIWWLITTVRTIATTKCLGAPFPARMVFPIDFPSTPVWCCFLGWLVGGFKYVYLMLFVPYVANPIIDHPKTFWQAFQEPLALWLIEFTTWSSHFIGEKSPINIPFWWN